MRLRWAEQTVRETGVSPLLHCGLQAKLTSLWPPSDSLRPSITSQLIRVPPSFVCSTLRTHSLVISVR